MLWMESLMMGTNMLFASFTKRISVSPKSIRVTRVLSKGFSVSGTSIF